MRFNLNCDIEISLKIIIFIYEKYILTQVNFYVNGRPLDEVKYIPSLNERY